MSQPPFLVDVVQIEPGSGDTLTISRDSTDGALKFVDAVIVSGVLLPALVGMRNITGVFIVGRAGMGAPYTSVQAAFDAIPNTSNAAAPSIVWLMPGVYSENLVLQKDGVFIVSPGGAKLINTGASDTLEISSSIDVTPLQTVIRGVTIENTNPASACVKVLGADTFATGTVTVITAPLIAGDSITIDGNLLVGVTGTRTSGSDNFSVSGGTVAAIAAEISAAINDVANSFATTVEASPAGAVVTITAVVAGTGGNAITLAVSTTPPGGVLASGANLTGGSSAGSLVASQGLVLDDCTLLASGVGSYQITADTANYLLIRGGTWRGSSSTSSCSIANCSSFRVFDVEWTNDIQTSYNTALDRPADLSSAYEVKNCGRMGDVISNHLGAGSLTVSNCPEGGNLTVGGSQTLSVNHAEVGDLTLSGTTVAEAHHTTREAIVLASGTPTLAETLVNGSVAFVASLSQVVTFTIPQPDSSYRVALESPSTTVTLAVTAKLAASFTISASVALTGTVGYSVTRT